MITVARASLLACHECAKIVPMRDHPPRSRLLCPRCGAALRLRKPASLSRTMALVIAALILYVPANLYPIMTLKLMGKGEPHTILGGVIELIEADAYECAALVLFASIVVPLLKLVGLTFLCYTVHRKSRWRPRDRTLLYRVIEVIGRWSMIDIFMVSILVALVNVGGIAFVDPGLGATFFAAVVVITMFAAEAFDPRLIWDAVERQE